MKTIGFYVLIAFGAIAIAYAITEHIKERGRAEVRAEISVRSAATIKAATDRAAQIVQESERRVNAAEQQLAILEKRLEGLRDAQIKPGSDIVVFDREWADWLRGEAKRSTGH
jgi:Flp pilus assembly protein TadB